MNQWTALLQLLSMLFVSVYFKDAPQQSFKLPATLSLPSFTHLCRPCLLATSKQLQAWELLLDLLLDHACTASWISHGLSIHMEHVSYFSLLLLASSFKQHLARTIMRISRDQLSSVFQLQGSSTLMTALNVLKLATLISWSSDVSLLQQVLHVHHRFSMDSWNPFLLLVCLTLTFLKLKSDSSL